MLAEEFPGCTVAPRFHDPSEAKSYIATMDYFCGARMHACLAAFSTGVPLAPLAYSRKATGLFHSLDYPLVVDGTAETTADAVDRTLAGFEQREELARIIAAGNRKANNKLVAYEDVLREVFAAAVEAKS